MYVRLSKVPNWGRGGREGFLKEGWRFGSSERGAVEDDDSMSGVEDVHKVCKKVEGYGVEARNAKRGLLRRENTLRGIDVKG